MLLRAVLLFSIILLFGCKQKPSDASIQDSSFKKGLSNTTISGKIENAPMRSVVLSTKEFHDTIELDGNNHFLFKLHLEEAQYFNLSDGKSRVKIFIEPKNELFISFNSSNVFNTIKFDGFGANPNNYLKQKHLQMLNYAMPTEHLFEKPVVEFRYMVDSIYVISKMYFDEFQKENPDLPTIFIETEIASLTYNRAAQLMEYLLATSHSREIDEESYLKFIDKLSVNENKWLDVYEYRLFLSAYIDYYSAKVYKTQNLSQHEITLIKLQTVTKQIQNQDIKDHLLFTILRDHVKFYGYKNTELLFKTFEFQCKNEKMKAGILTPYYEYVKLSQKQKAPEISMIDVDGKTYSLSSFLGSYIYIDVWATWCMPCRKEMPLFDELKDKYKHKNIQFISISIDQKKEEWLEFLTLKSTPVDHYLATDIEAFLDAYLIKTIPHFLIIDDKGNLININANRPSDSNKKWLDEIPNKLEV